MGDLDRAIPLHQQVLADRQRVLGQDQPSTMTSRGNLAVAYEAAGDLDRAIPLYEQVLADRQQVLGDDHPDTLTASKNLAGGPTMQRGTWTGLSSCTSRSSPTGSKSSATTTPTPWPLAATWPTPTRPLGTCTGLSRC